MRRPELLRGWQGLGSYGRLGGPTGTNEGPVAALFRLNDFKV